jgi:hypothetical protein
MMGVNMGYQPGPRQSIAKKYAWFPVKTNSDRWLWFKEYYKIFTYYDENGKPPIKSLCWELILSKNEYLVWIIKKSNC